MRHHTLTNRTVVAIGVALLATAIIAPTYAVWPAFQFDPPVIGSLNLERVFNEIRQLQQAQAELEAELTKFQEQAEALKQEAERLWADLELLVPGTEKYAKAEKEWKRAVLDLQAVVAFADAKRDSMLSDARRLLFSTITDAAAEFAKANGIDFIITNDSGLSIQQQLVQSELRPDRFFPGELLQGGLAAPGAGYTVFGTARHGPAWYPKRRLRSVQGRNLGSDPVPISVAGI